MIRDAGLVGLLRNESAEERRVGTEGEDDGKSLGGSRDVTEED